MEELSRRRAVRRRQERLPDRREELIEAREFAQVAAASWSRYSGGPWRSRPAADSKWSSFGRTSCGLLGALSAAVLRVVSGGLFLQRSGAVSPGKKISAD